MLCVYIYMCVYKPCPLIVYDMWILWYVNPVKSATKKMELDSSPFTCMPVWHGHFTKPCTAIARGHVLTLANWRATLWTGREVQPEACKKNEKCWCLHVSPRCNNKNAVASAMSQWCFKKHVERDMDRKSWPVTSNPSCKMFNWSPPCVGLLQSGCCTLRRLPR